MPILRKLHLYLGVIFAPALLFFAFSGALQIFEYHESKKGGYQAPAALVTLGEVHKHQRLASAPRSSGRWTKIFFTAAAIGLSLTTILGVVMAFKLSRSAIPVVICLLAGLAIPIVLLFLAR